MLSALFFGERWGKLRVCMLRRSWVREICTYLYLTKVPYLTLRRSGEGGRGLFLPRSGIPSIFIVKSGTISSCQTFAASRRIGTQGLLLFIIVKGYLFYLAVAYPTPPRQREPESAHREPDQKKTKGQKYTRLKKKYRVANPTGEHIFLEPRVEFWCL